MKKILFLIFLVAIVVGGISLALRFERKETLDSNPKGPKGAAEVTALLTKDSDSDGLKDWEEELWETDLLNPDTDGDGTNDSEEIRERRNPLVKGPDDPLDESSIMEKTTLEDQTGPETETDKLAREFFGTYLEVKKDGGQLTPESIEAFSEKLFLSSPDLKTRIYSEKDLILSQESDSAAMRNYGNEIGLIIASVPAPPENELDLLNRAAESEDRAAIERLGPIIDGYTQLLTELETVPVPEGAEDGHILLLQSFDGLRVAVTNMRQLFQKLIKNSRF